MRTVYLNVRWRRVLSLLSLVRLVINWLAKISQPINYLSEIAAPIIYKWVKIMSKLYCNQSSKFLPIFAELEDLPSTCIANCVFNIFLTYTAFMLNIVTIYAIHKTSTMPKTLKTLLLSLACSDVAVGLFSQPLYTFFLINQDISNCTTAQESHSVHANTRRSSVWGDKKINCSN